MNIYTIGFTGKTAQEFFEKLQSAEARYLLDIRIHNNSQLAGFTKKGNIEYFTQHLTDLSYNELKILAPTDEMFKQYRDDKDWTAYEIKYVQLLKDRNLSSDIDKSIFEEGTILLCSEPTPEKCHRRLAAEFLKDTIFEDAHIHHL